MTRRISHLAALITFLRREHPNGVPNAVEIEASISQWLTASASTLGLKRSLLRRDLIRQNGYVGVGAQARFAADLRQALLSGDATALWLALRALPEDREVLSGLLTSPVVAPPVVEAPVVAPPVVEAEPVESQSATAVWLGTQIREGGLIPRIAASLRRRDPHAEQEDLISDVGLWLSTWIQKGTFDAVIEEKGHVPFAWLVRAIEKKRTSQLYKLARDPLYRLRGARTQHEVNIRLQTGDAGYVAPESVRSGDMEWVTAYSDDGEAIGHDLVCPEASPEDLVEEHMDRDHVVAVGRQIVAAAYRGAVARYTAIYDVMIRQGGASTQDIMALDGCSKTRAEHLSCSIRGALRDGAVTRTDAERILGLLAAEPWSSREEIQSGLRIDCPSFRRAVALLQSGDLIRQGSDDEVYALS